MVNVWGGECLGGERLTIGQGLVIMMIMVVMVMMRIIAQTGGPGPGYNDGDLIIITR